jgi:hypothetical protein
MNGKPGPGDDVPATTPEGEVQAEYDWSAVTPSTAVVETLAVAMDREPTKITPLYESVDPDALDTLVSQDRKASSAGNSTVSFHHDGHEVTVDAAGTIIVRLVEATGE